MFLRDRMNTKIKMILVIPCLAETEIWDTLKSLRGNFGFRSKVHCIIVINHSEKESEGRKVVNKYLAEQLKLKASEFESTQLSLEILEAFDLPDKKAGVGTARKLGMDKAIEIFKDENILDRGIIVCLDGDCVVSPNYFSEIEKYFEKHNANGCSIYFEHPLERENSNGIVEYELYLRYYINALRWCGFPNAFQTVGSSMAVKATAYIKQGGMNTRKAGEDFYFLNKIIQLGNFGDLTTTTVFPSPRKSDRVPFGTGREMMEYETSQKLLAYSPELFKELKSFLSLAMDYRVSENPLDLLPGKVTINFINYLNALGFEEKINEIKKHTASEDAFKKRFFVWMDAFQIMKLLNDLSNKFYPKIPIVDCAAWLLSELTNSSAPNTAKYLLVKYREHDITHPKFI